ncbi:MAG TPA: BON domain-containing protein [Verrucomicrobiae bacterium]|nr:BON domain-containing protein [Verrucomicrobiae bacterium]
MTSKFIFFGLCGSVAALTAYGQSAPAAAGTPAPGSNPAGTTPPGLQQRDQLPPGLQNRRPMPPGLAGRTNGTTASGSLSGTNSMTPSQSGGSGAATAASDPVSADRELLTKVRQSVSTEISSVTGSSFSAGSSGALPINYIVRSGVVELVGSVPSEQQKERIEAVVQGVPGVTSVENRLQVMSAVGSSTGGTLDGASDGTVGSGSASGTGSSANATAGAFSGTNRLSATSSTYSSNASPREILSPTSNTNGLGRSQTTPESQPRSPGAGGNP